MNSIDDYKIVQHLNNAMVQLSYAKLNMIDKDLLKDLDKVSEQIANVVERILCS